MNDYFLIIPFLILLAFIGFMCFGGLAEEKDRKLENNGIGDFLEYNGFDRKANAYSNGKCVIVLKGFKCHVYHGDTDFNLYDCTYYEIIGYLTHENLMDKNFKSINHENKQ